MKEKGLNQSYVIDVIKLIESGRSSGDIWLLNKTNFC